MAHSATSFSATGLSSILIYQFINLLFLSKYLPRFTNLYPSLILIYFIAILLFFFFGRRIIERISSPSLLILFSLGAALLLLLLMKQFSPEEIRVGRERAIKEWLTQLLSGEFPYITPTRPSGFPFLFFIALPFYLLGDLGLLQIFGFLLFSYLLSRRSGFPLFSLCLLLLSPLFLFEVTTRSEIFTNMVLVLSYLFLFELKGEKIKGLALIIYGILGGFLLATRGIVLLPYLIFFPIYFKKNSRVGFLFAFSCLGGFLAINLPFFLWNPGHYIKNGPFSIQTAYLPYWLILPSLILALLYGLKWGEERSYFGITLFTFFIIFIPFILRVLNYGISAVIFKTKFDISYFAFCLPFLLFTLESTKRRDTFDSCDS